MKLQAAGLALLLASCNAMHAHDHEVEWVDYGENPMMNEEYMAAMMAASTPGEVHAELAKGVGHYEVTGRHWTSPDSDPMPMTATANVEMILDGRYLMETFESDFMGMPFEGRMILGYDNLAEEYWNVWIDNMRTGCMMARGTEREDGDLVMTGTVRDPLTPEGRPFRIVTSQQGEDTFTVRMFDVTPEGDEYQSMELVYVRS